MKYITEPLNNFARYARKDEVSHFTYERAHLKIGSFQNLLFLNNDPGKRCLKQVWTRQPLLFPRSLVLFPGSDRGDKAGERGEDGKQRSYKEEYSPNTIAILSSSFMRISI